ncbi:MAG: hypothetical protein ACPGJV_04865 [Bacteriovoracaceae bacterium]
MDNSLKIKEAQKQWGIAVVNSDLEKLMSLYDDGASLKPTLSKVIRVGKENVKDYFVGNPDEGRAGFLSHGWKDVVFHSKAIHGDNEILVDMGEYEFVGPNGDVTWADYSYVYRVSGEQTVILAHHSSLKYEE